MEEARAAIKKKIPILDSSRLRVSILKSNNLELCTGDNNQITITGKVYFEGKECEDSPTKMYSSTIGGILYRWKEHKKLLITSGHYNSVDTKFYSHSDGDMHQQYLGKCVYSVYNKVDKDIAVIDLEDIPLARLSNVVSHPGGQSWDCMPQIFPGDVTSLRNGETDLVKHSRQQAHGKYTMVIEDGRIFHGMVNGRDDICLNGDSGSLVTSLPGSLGSHEQQVSAVGVVAGRKSIIYLDDQDRSLQKTVCIFSPLPPFLNHADIMFISPVVNVQRSPGLVDFTGRVRAPGQTSLPRSTLDSDQHIDSGYAVT